MKIAKYIGLASLPFLAILFYLFCLNHISVNEIGIQYNSSNGKLTVQTNAGWYITSPFVRVATIETIPIRVQILSGANLVNQKLVRFKPEGALDFVAHQGFSYYIFPSGLDNILVGYAFSGKPYSFLEILE